MSFDYYVNSEMYSQNQYDIIPYQHNLQRQLKISPFQEQATDRLLDKKTIERSTLM